MICVRPVIIRPPDQLVHSALVYQLSGSGGDLRCARPPDGVAMKEARVGEDHLAVDLAGKGVGEEGGVALEELGPLGRVQAGREWVPANSALATALQDPTAVQAAGNWHREPPDRLIINLNRIGKRD
jgi:hypothetical protein